MRLSSQAVFRPLPHPSSVARPYRPAALVALAGLLALATLALPAFAEPAAHPLAGHWEGEIALPTGELQVMVDLVQGAEGWTGTIDIPMQGATDLALQGIEISTDTARFTISGVPGEPTFDGKLVESELRGSFTQGPAELTFRLSREKVEAPARPQEPQPPFPYRSEEVSYDNGDIHLAATLTLPPGEGPFPAVVLITGSGPQNRNEELAGHKPFLVLADHLTRAGIAVLRADDRGVGGSSGTVDSSTSSDFADDALAGVAWLKKRPEIAADRIGLVGHSEGGLVAPLAATRSKEVAFLVLLAGPGVAGDEIILLQTELIAAANGADKEAIQAQVDETRKVFELIRKGGEDAALQAALTELVQRQLASISDTERAALGDDPEAAIQQQISRVTTPWFRYFLTYDPAATLRKVKVPVLALNGSLDLQVDAEQNLPAIEKALATAENPDFTVRRMAGLNHLFQHAQTGSPVEYATLEETFAPEALGLISSWITERFERPQATAVVK